MDKVHFLLFPWWTYLVYCLTLIWIFTLDFKIKKSNSLIIDIVHQVKYQTTHDKKKHSRKEAFLNWNQMRHLESHILNNHFVALSFLSKVFPRGELAPCPTHPHPLHISHLSSHLSAHGSIQSAWTLSDSHLGSKAKLSKVTVQPPPYNEQNPTHMKLATPEPHASCRALWVAMTHLPRDH